MQKVRQDIWILLHFVKNKGTELTVRLLLDHKKKKGRRDWHPFGFSLFFFCGCEQFHDLFYGLAGFFNSFEDLLLGFGFLLFL